MAELDLGVLVGRATLDTSMFDRAYASVLRKFGTLGKAAQDGAAGVGRLDESLASVGAASDKAAAGIGRVTESSTRATQAETRAAVAADKYAATMAGLAGESAKVQQATLRQVAAQERMDALNASGTATTRQLASAQATLIGATRSVARAQDEGAVSGGRFRTALGSTLKMAGGLGLAFGAFEILKKAIDITKEANDFQRSMVLVQTNADVSATEVRKASAALLAMAGPVAAAPNDLATAWYHAKSVGLDYAKSIDTTRIAAEGARIGHADLEQTMNALTSTVASNIPGVKNMSSAMGQLIAIVGSGDMKLSDLNQALGSGILTVVKGYGLSLTDVGAALATFGDNNIRGADAATMLRMAVQAMAVPAVAGRKELASLGLQANTLATDMQKGGLNKAILDLKAHLDAAGVSSVQVGAVLTQVFGKRAGPGIAVLISQSDRLQSKFAILRDSGASFASKWKATTQTASFALASLGHSLEAAGIAATVKLGPAIAAAASWLTTTIPHAVQVASAILSPLAHLVGGILVGAWHALSAVLGVVGGALSGIAGFLEHNRTLVTALVTGLGALYGAMKLIALGKAAFAGMDLLLGKIAARAASAAAGMSRVGSATSGIGAGAVIMGTFAGAIALVTAAWQVNAQRAAAAKERVAEYASALQQTNGVITTQIELMLRQKIAADGVYDSATKYGISQKLVTDAAGGSVDATLKLIAATHGSYDAVTKVLVPLFQQGNALQTASRQYKQAAAGTASLTAAQRAAAVATKSTANNLGVSASAYAAAEKAASDNTAQTNSQTLAFQAENDAASLLQQALNGLAGVNLSTATAQTSLASANLSVAASFKTNGAAINGSSKAAVNNQQAIEQQVSAAQQYAEAIGKQTGSSDAAVAAMHRSKAALEDQLRSQGKLTPAVQAYINKLYNLSHLKVPPTKLDADKRAADAKISALQARINAIRQGKKPGLSADSHDGERVIAQLQGEINSIRQHTRPTVSVNIGGALNSVNALRNALAGLPQTKSVRIQETTLIHTPQHVATGGYISGPGSGTSDSIPARLSNGEFVVRAAQTAKHLPLLRAINAGVQGFAAGGKVTRDGKDWVYGGIHYASKRAADNARTRDSQKDSSSAHYAEHATLSVDKSVKATAAAMFTVDKAGVGHGSVAKVSAILGPLTKWEAALKKAGVPKSTLNRLKSDNKTISNAATARNKAAGQLMAAQKSLAAAMATKKADTSAFKGAVTGSFDITSAGADDNGNITAGSLLAASHQAVAKARQWAADLRKLTSEGVFPDDYLRELAAKGPDALPQVDALAHMNMADLKSLRSDAVAINTLGQQAGSVASQRLDQPAITKYQKQVRADQAKELAAQRKLTADLNKTLKDGVKGLVDVIGQPQPLTGTLTLKAGPGGTVLGTLKGQHNKARTARGHKQ